MIACVNSPAYATATQGLQLVQETAPSEEGLHLYLGKNVDTYVFIRFFYEKETQEWNYNKTFEDHQVKSVSNSPLRKNNDD